RRPPGRLRHRRNSVARGHRRPDHRAGGAAGAVPSAGHSGASAARASAGIIEPVPGPRRQLGAAASQGPCEPKAMARGRWIVYALVSLFLVAGVAYYWAPWQTTEQTPGGKGKKGKKGKKGGPNTSDPVPILAVTAKVADVPDYLDGVGT